MNKKELIKDLRRISVDQIVEAIQNGTVTLYELSKSGNLTPLTKMKIETKLLGGQKHANNLEEGTPVNNSSLQTEEIFSSNEISTKPAEDIDESDSQDVIIPEAVYNPSFDYNRISPSKEAEDMNVASTGVKKVGFFKKLFDKK